MRPLTLHASALNDEEYDLYTTSLNELAWADDKDTQAHDDAYYEEMHIGVREARGWLRGRYAHLPPGAIDAILRFFSPALSHKDVLTGGQFFAVLRLVVHVENRKDVDRALAFVQAHPAESAVSKRPSVDVTSPPLIPYRNLGYAPPTPASSTPTSESQTGANPFSALQPPVHPFQRTESVKSPHSPHNPFVTRSSTDTRPPLPPRKPAPPAPAHPILVPPPRHSSILLSTSSRRSTSPTRHSSTAVTLVPVSGPNLTPGVPNHHPHVPPKPAHVTSTLMKQSLQASKAAQTMKRAEEQLERERVLQVLRSSAVVSGTQVRSALYRSVSPGKVNAEPEEGPEDGEGDGDGDGDGEGVERGRAPPLPRRRHTHTQQQPSPPVSVSSLEQVALAQASTTESSAAQTRLPSPLPPLPSRSITNPFPSTTDKNPYHRALPDGLGPHTRASSKSSTTSVFSSPTTSPARASIDLPATRPPTHPDRKLPAFPFTSPLHGSPFHNHNHNPFPSQSPFASPTTAVVTPESSPTARVFRSKSLHHPSPPLPPLPAPTPPRKRPESVQVLSPTSGAGSVFGDGAEMVFATTTPEGRGKGLGSGSGSGSGSGPGLARHMSFSTPTQTPTPPHRRQSSFSAVSGASSVYGATRSDGVGVGTGTGVGGVAALGGGVGESPLHKLAKTWQPRLEKARYKAEAGLSRRGYIRERDVVGRSRSRGRGEREDLIAGGEYGDGEDYEPPSVDGLSLDESDEGGGEGEKERRVGVIERDGMKWPVGEGEGWRPL